MMGIFHEQLREYIIRPVLHKMGVYTEAGEELLVLTAATESLGGTFIHQVGGGPALGIYQMEPATCRDCYENYLKYNPGLMMSVDDYTSDEATCPKYEQMVGNLCYATAMCRAQYLRFSEPLPPAYDIPALAEYYKQYWNTYLGSASVEDAIRNYRDYTKT